MAANVKLSRAEILKREAQQNAQNSNLMSMIGSLGSGSTITEKEDISNKSVTETEEPVRQATGTVNKTVTAKSGGKAEKPGYISLVITPTLKKEWKTYCTEHGLSLTDCIKVSMKLLKDMEKKNAISLEDGVLSYLN